MHGPVKVSINGVDLGDLFCQAFEVGMPVVLESKVVGMATNASEKDGNVFVDLHMPALDAMREAAGLPALTEEKRYDMSGDATCRMLLRAWAKKPWDRGTQAALADRARELGNEEAGSSVMRWGHASYIEEKSRSQRRYIIAGWKNTLRHLYGDYEEYQPNSHLL